MYAVLACQNCEVKRGALHPNSKAENPQGRGFSARQDQRGAWRNRVKQRFRRGEGMGSYYRATAIFSRIISLTISDGDLWVDSEVARSHVEDTSSKMTIFPLCFIKNPVFPSPETFGGLFVTILSRASASSSVILGIFNLFLAAICGTLSQWDSLLIERRNSGDFLSFSFVKQTAIDTPALHSVKHIVMS